MHRHVSAHVILKLKPELTVSGPPCSFQSVGPHPTNRCRPAQFEVRVLLRRSSARQRPVDSAPGTAAVRNLSSRGAMFAIRDQCPATRKTRAGSSLHPETCSDSPVPPSSAQARWFPRRSTADARAWQTLPDRPSLPLNAVFVSSLLFPIANTLAAPLNPPMYENRSR